MVEFESTATSGDLMPPRTPVVLVTGLDPEAVARTADALVVAGTTLVHHDLDAVGSGRVVRTVRAVDLDGNEITQVTEVNLAHGCVSCTLRLDLLPLLRRLHRRSSVENIVIQLDSALEPEAVAWAIDEVVVTDMPGFIDAPAGSDVVIDATIACVSELDWLEAATGDETLGGDADDGGSGEDEDRTLAQVAVAQVGFADALVVAAADPSMRDQWTSARTMAVLRRLAPRAPMVMELPQRPIRPLIAVQLLRAIPEGARRGRIDGPHDPLLRDQPPLEEECGVRVVEFTAERPFHPQRLHAALDVLLDGVVCTRGRMWLANRPDDAFWVESAGEGLRVAIGGPWLAAMSVQEREFEDPERRAMAALRWDPEHGDRHSALVILAHRADPDTITGTLSEAVLTDAEMADGQTLWMAYPDPFGVAHSDPCDDLEQTDRRAPTADSITDTDTDRKDQQ
ncbi:ribosome hibernation factor-recruiting GTPase MRF [Gordonia sp. NPDC003504]